MSKKPLTGLFRDNPTTPEGKYLIKRRDGTVPPWPSFVLGGADPIAEVALRAYALEVARLLTYDPTQAAEMGLTPEFMHRLMAWANEFAEWRRLHGEGDPGMGPHRVDNPAIVAEMRKGLSA